MYFSERGIREKRKYKPFIYKGLFEGRRDELIKKCCILRQKGRRKGFFRGLEKLEELEDIEKLGDLGNLEKSSIGDHGAKER